MVGVSASMLSALPATLLQTTVDPLVFVVVAFGVFLVAAVVAPIVLLSVRDTREPTADERDRLAGLAEAADCELGTVAVVETVGEHSVELSIRGPPGRRWLLVTDYVLEELDSETATALLAAEAGRSRLFYMEYRALAAATVIAIATGMFGGLFPFSDGLFVLAVAAFGLFWGGRQLQFSADSVAASTVGADSLAEAFETVAALRGVEPEAATWRTWFEVQPPLGQRIDRLRDRS